MRKVIVIGTGGSGIDMSVPAYKNAVSFGLDDDVELKYIGIDTSKDNSAKALSLGDFYIIDPLASTKKSLAGSGGNMKTNINAIKAGIPKFLKEAKFDKPLDNTLFIVVGGTGGGSGATILPFLVESLNRTGNIVLPLIATDTGDEQSAQNSLNALSIIHKSALNNVTNISAFIKDNNEYGEAEVDEQISLMLLRCSIFFSDKMVGVDPTELEYMLNPIKANVGFKPGLVLVDQADNTEDLKAFDNLGLVKQISAYKSEKARSINAKNVRAAYTEDASLIERLQNDDNEPFYIFNLVSGVNALFGLTKENAEKAKIEVEETNVELDDIDDFFD